MPQAEADLEAIREYYERVAPDYAQTFVDGAVEKTQQLVTYNESDFEGVEDFGIQATGPGAFLKEIGEAEK